jgi:glutamate racemase
MIGIFDSGSGGLTVLKAIRERFPSCDVVYFGDIANVPYGSKTPAELLQLVVGGISLLQKQGATKLVMACNSVSASMALSLFDATGYQALDLVEMVGPTVSYFKNSDYKIALCATPATVASGIYQTAFKLVGKDIATFTIPDLAPAIEFGAPQDEVRQIISQSLKAADLAEFDVLILACTHYPLVTSIFAELFPGIQLFDPAVAVAERVEKRFWPQEVGDGKTRFLLSKDSEPFTHLVQQMFPDKTYTVEVVQ